MQTEVLVRLWVLLLVRETGGGERQVCDQGALMGRSLAWVRAVAVKPETSGSLRCFRNPWGSGRSSARVLGLHVGGSGLDCQHCKTENQKSTQLWEGQVQI